MLQPAQIAPEEFIIFNAYIHTDTPTYLVLLAGGQDLNTLQSKHCQLNTPSSKLQQKAEDIPLQLDMPPSLHISSSSFQINMVSLPISRGNPQWHEWHFFPH